MAVGPYPGTFTETGTATLGPQGTGPLSQGLEARALLSFSASFTVQSGSDQVADTKGNCGTIACAMGWAAEMPGFRELVESR